MELCQFLMSSTCCWMVYIHHVYFQHPSISAHLFSCYFCLLQIKLLWSWLYNCFSDHFPLFSYGRVISSVVSLHVSNHSMFFLELKTLPLWELDSSVVVATWFHGPGIVLAFFVFGFLDWLLIVPNFPCRNLVPDVKVVGGGSWRVVIIGYEDGLNDGLCWKSAFIKRHTGKFS